ncbi:MAG: transcriptional regulator [Phycisphaerae bacterium]|nr:transcriptional regulator [Phycisphaerae bacterium]
MARGELILRQWNLLKTLQTRGEGIPLRKLADEFDVSERTIQRDFEVLEELGFPVEHNEDEYGKRYWRMPYDFFKTGPLVLGLTEAVSLHLAESFFAPLAGTHFADGLRTILDKVRSLIPARALDYFCELDGTIYVRRSGITDYSAHAETIRVLSDAAHMKHTVEVTYRSLWRSAEYTTLFDPYGLVYFEGDLFLVGHSHKAKALRVFKVTRVVAAALTEQAFETPHGFDLAQHFESTFGIVQSDGEPIDVVVRFSGTAATLVEERVWHESQRLEWLPGEETLFESEGDDHGNLQATFKLANLVEFKRWLKGYGDQVEVVRPDWLRREMHDELLAAARVYRK